VLQVSDRVGHPSKKCAIGRAKLAYPREREEKLTSSPSLNHYEVRNAISATITRTIHGLRLARDPYLDFLRRSEPCLPGS
jgi:hypothetical protein